MYTLPHRLAYNVVDAYVMQHTLHAHQQASHRQQLNSLVAIDMEMTLVKTTQEKYLRIFTFPRT